MFCAIFNFQTRSTASEDILGGMLGSQGWEGLQAILGILIITGSVSGTDAMVRRAFGF